MKEMTGTRSEIEGRLLQFLYDLKYYSTRWLRAKLYAEMVGFVQQKGREGTASSANAISTASDHSKHPPCCPDAGKVPERMPKPNESLLDAAAGLNDHNFEDVHIPATDIYA